MLEISKNYFEKIIYKYDVDHSVNIYFLIMYLNSLNNREHNIK